MEIIKAKYSSEDNNWVSLTFSDGSVGQVGTTDGIRRQYTDIFQEYIDNGGTIEPLHTEAELARMEQERINSEAKAYLASTDWYVSRKMEVGTDVPQHILDARQQARDAVVHLPSQKI